MRHFKPTAVACREYDRTNSSQPTKVMNQSSNMSLRLSDQALQALAQPFLHVGPAIAPPNLSPHQLQRLQQIRRLRLEIRLARARAHAPTPPDTINTASSILQRLQEGSKSIEAPPHLLVASAPEPTLKGPPLNVLKAQIKACRSHATSPFTKSAPINKSVEPSQARAVQSSLITGVWPKQTCWAGQGHGPGAAMPAKPLRQPRHKKPKDMPRRALSAYNYFFKEERQRILADIPNPEGAACSRRRRRDPHGKIGFETLAQLVGQRWQNIRPEQVQYYKELAEADKVRYHTEMDEYLKARHKLSIPATQKDASDSNNEVDGSCC